MTPLVCDLREGQTGVRLKWTKDDGWHYCAMAVVLLQLASGVTVIPHEIRSHMNSQCVCFRFDMILISLE